MLNLSLNPSESHAIFKLKHEVLSLEVMTANVMINLSLTRNESHAKFRLKRQVLSLDVMSANLEWLKLHCGRPTASLMTKAGSSRMELNFGRGLSSIHHSSTVLGV